MVWSDVLFRLAGSSGVHYDQNSRIPEEIRAALPREVDLAYWDYYSGDPQHYRTASRLTGPRLRAGDDIRHLELADALATGSDGAVRRSLRVSLPGSGLR